MAEKAKLTHLQVVQAKASYNFLTRKRHAEEEAAFKESLAAGEVFDPEEILDKETTVVDDKKGK